MGSGCSTTRPISVSTTARSPSSTATSGSSPHLLVDPRLDIRPEPERPHCELVGLRREVRAADWHLHHRVGLRPSAFSQLRHSDEPDVLEDGGTDLVPTLGPGPLPSL